MHYILTAAQMREADQRTSEKIGLPSVVLMERAALAVAAAVKENFPLTGGKPAPRVAVLAGRGNNGADGVAAGRLLRNDGYEVRVFLTGGAAAEESLCARQLHILEEYGGKAEPFERVAFSFFRPDAVIDAMTGIGQKGGLDPESMAGQAARLVNDLRHSLGTRVYAVDLPSGVLADTGGIGACAVCADRTITFGYQKRGQVLYPGAMYCGALSVDDIGIRLPEKEERKDQEPLLFGYDTEKAGDLLPARSPAGNKGTFGKVLVVAGSRNMCGAALLCGTACARSGAGMVKIVTEECNRGIVQSAAPELLLDTWEPSDFGDEKSRNAVFRRLSADLSWADTVVAGPGIGQGKAAGWLVAFILAWLAEKDFRGLVLDADAIRIIGKDPQLLSLAAKAGEHGPVVFTPHMAECAALLGMDVAALKKDWLPLLRQFADAHHCCILCKDARSAAAAFGEDRIYLNVSGNDGLSTAGSGDVLAGMTAAFLAQGMEAFPAACAASWLHGKAAEKLTKDGGGSHNTRSLMAGDLVRAMGELYRE